MNDIPIDVLRHSGAHLLAHAVLDLYPETKTGIGPAVESGFYYDFLREAPFTPEDLEKIETRMKKIVGANAPVERVDLAGRGLRMFEDKGQHLKVELIREKGDAPSPSTARARSPTSAAGPTSRRPAPPARQAALRRRAPTGRATSADRRCSGSTAPVFADAKELDEHLRRLEEAKKRDHRRLGKELDLFRSDDEIGGGLVLWHPKGARVRYVIEELLARGAPGGRLRPRLHPPHRARAALGDLRAPRLLQRQHVLADGHRRAARTSSSR